MPEEVKYFYYTDHPLSIEMSKYFSDGFGTIPQHVNKVKEIQEPGFFYGILRNCYEGMMFLKSLGKDFYYVDYGYIRKSKINNELYYRICKNSRFHCFFQEKIKSDRFEELGIEINYKKNQGQKIVLFEPSPYVCMINGLNQLQWTDHIKEQIRKYTKRDIIITRKSSSNTDDPFKDMYVLVHYASMGAIEALIKNIPIITLGDFFLEKIYNNKIENIESLSLCKNREKILYNLAYNQYNLKEIRSGKAKEILEKLGAF